jgi:hypothetical protein
MPPVLIAAGVTAAATIGGSLLSSKATSKAATTASNTETQVARENNALATQFRAENTANFAPNLQSGFRANSLLDSFLYGGPQGGTAPTATTQPYGAPMPASGGGMGGLVMDSPGAFYGGGDDYSQMGEFSGFRLPSPLSGYGGAGYSNPGGYQAPSPVNVPAPQPANAMSGYEQFQASPYYQFPLQEGMRQLNSGLASGGRLFSGDAAKRAIKFGQDYGAGRMGEYLGLAEGQVNRGVQGAGAIAGVGLNALNSISGNNQNAADAAANAALLRGNANAGVWNAAAGSIGNVLGSINYGSSYNKKKGY